jgi:hypothetical protein
MRESGSNLHATTPEAFFVIGSGRRKNANAGLLRLGIAEKVQLRAYPDNPAQR